jgi:hypothetical protein
MASPGFVREFRRRLSVAGLQRDECHQLCIVDLAQRQAPGQPG